MQNLEQSVILHVFITAATKVMFFLKPIDTHENASFSKRTCGSSVHGMLFQKKENNIVRNVIIVLKHTEKQLQGKRKIAVPWSL